MEFLAEGKVVKKNIGRNIIPAMVICFPYICTIISVNGISVFLAFTLFVLAAFELACKKYKLTEHFFLLIVFIILLFAFSFIRINNQKYTYDFFQRFILYDIVAFLVGLQKTEKEKVMRAIVVIGIIGCPVILARDLSETVQSDNMGLCYACLPIFLMSIIELVEGKEKTKYKVVAAINIFCLSTLYYKVANRGIWVIIFSLIIILLYYHICRSGITGTKKIRAILFLLTLGCLALYVLINIEQVTVRLYEFIDRVFHVRIYALWKLQYYFSKGDISNGRDANSVIAIQTILKNPILGSGIGFYESINDGQYCHNIFLQSLCEAGLLLFLPVTCYVLSVGRYLLFCPFKVNRKPIDYKFVSLGFCCGLEMFFFSSSYWIYPLFWFFLGCFLSTRREDQEFLTEFLT